MNKASPRTLLPALLLAAAQFASVQSASAAEMTLAVEIPTLDVAEYHKPYVAIWIENNRTKAVTNLAVWYDTGMRNNEGEKWLKDMRQWWRRTGRTLQMPVDGVTGATKGPGQHNLQFRFGAQPLDTLEAGDYTLRVEAAREVGGRELLNLPFSWPLTAEANDASRTHTGGISVTQSGTEELGSVALHINP
ncbi:MAG: DUF2271 domain-containing protein [Saccharospirillaceae bacterium]|nr:DUF2271 domain-containing protein [Saccharospirillaceae bacterium]MCD8532554.1 DUF2271 domain-containing protein [Saccharospirillaceae bacterium]